MTEPIKVLIVDDHPLFRDGLTALLTDSPDTELVGAATSGTEAVELARETQPDVVVMDLHMPGLNGVEATRRIVADSPHITVLVLTMFDDDDSIFSALRAGARGYLLKGADQEQIRAAIQAAANGEIIFGTQLAARMLAYFTTPAAAPAPVFPQLTDREREVLEPSRAGPGQHSHCDPARAEPKDGAEPRVEHPDQAAGRRPGPGHRAGQGRRPGTTVPGLRDIPGRSRPPSGDYFPARRDRYLMTAGHPFAKTVVIGSARLRRSR